MHDRMHPAMTMSALNRQALSRHRIVEFFFADTKFCDSLAGQIATSYIFLGAQMLADINYANSLHPQKFVFCDNFPL